MSEDSHLEAGRPTRITKTVRFGVPNSVDLEIWVPLDPQNNRLTRLRVQKARTKHRKEVEAESRQIRFDNRGSLNSTASPYALLQMQLKKADEFAEQQYSIFRDVWLRRGGVESAAFIRTISWMVIQRQFGPRGNSIAAEEARRSCATGGLHPGLPQEAIRRAFDTLKTGWRDKLEIKALEWEAEAQGKTLTPTVRTSPLGLPDRQPYWVIEYKLDNGDWRSTHTFPALSRANSTLSQLQADFPEEQFRIRQPGSESADGRTEISSAGPNAAKPSKSNAARNIDRLRRDCGWSFNKLAERTGLEKKLILGHVNKGKGIRPNTLKLYADAFTTALKRKVTVAELDS